MAKLWTEMSEKAALTDLEQIRNELRPLGIELSDWPLPDHPELQALLAKGHLSDEEKAQVLHLLNFRFTEQSAKYGYKSQDIVTLSAATPNLPDILAKFDKVHTHSDDEVRYIIEGSGLFGFIMPDGAQTLLKVEAGEYIRVPAGTEHWFLLDDSRNIKAVRYFISPEGWVANYVTKDIRLDISENSLEGNSL